MQFSFIDVLNFNLLMQSLFIVNVMLIIIFVQQKRNHTMKKRLYFILSILLAGLLSCLLSAVEVQGKTVAAAVNPAGSTVSALSERQKPLTFIENKGQVVDQNRTIRTDIQFRMGAANGLNIFIGNGAIHYQFCKIDRKKQNVNNSNGIPNNKFKAPEADENTYDLYRMDVELVGANKNAHVITEQQQEYTENYFTSGSGENGTAVHSFNKITYKDIYPNIDWVLYVSNGQLKHEFAVRPGGRVADIQLKYGGATDLKINQAGDLIASTPQGAVTEHAPYTYQPDGQKINSSFKLTGDVLSYETGSYNGALIIDPTLAWATYYGNSGNEWGNGVATDGSGNVYMTGYTSSTACIATSGAYQFTFGGGTYDAFLVKFNCAGVRQWGSYYGGSMDDYGKSVAMDAAGNVYVVGYTNSPSGIATAGGHQNSYGGGSYDAFLMQFDGSGSRQWATYYGGTSYDDGFSVATDGSGNVYMAGTTSSTSGIATSGGYQNGLGGYYDAFLVQFNSSGVRQWATYYGGSGDDQGYGLAADGSGNVNMIGYTASASGIATTGASQNTFGGGYDAFLVQFNGSGTRQWATYFGGTNGEFGTGIATDGLGKVYITGITGSRSGIATSGAYQAIFGGGTYDAFLAQFNSSGTRQWATYYGGSGNDQGYSISTDGSAHVYMAGSTSSTSGIAIPGASQATFGGGTGDAFLVQFNSSGARQWASYFGGSTEDGGYGAATDGSGNAYMTGYTYSTSGIATPGAHQGTFGGGYSDAFLLKFAPPSIVGTLTVCGSNTNTLSIATPGGIWSSGNTSVATIGSGNGVVTGVTAGTATISYAVSGSIYTATVTVNALPASIVGATSLCAGNSISLSNASAGGTWSSSNTNVTINATSGVVTGSSAGTSVITYTNGGGCIGTKMVTVNPSPAPITGTGVVCAGLSTTMTDITAGGTWGVSNTNASVGSSTGLVSGLNAGTSTITYALSSGCSATSVVTINPSPASITGTTAVCFGLTISLGNTTAGGNWSSSNANATIDGVSGVVTGSSIGSSVITYALNTGCSRTSTVTVNSLPASISGTTTVCMGLTVSLSNTTTGGSWSSSNSNVSVGPSTGVVSGLTAGTSTITYTLSSGCTVTSVVTVNPLPASIAGTTAVCFGLTTSLSTTTFSGTWSSSNANAAVDAVTGIVTGSTVGTSIISYVLNTGCVATATVTINPLPASISGTTSVCAGLTTSLNNSTTGGTWSSCNSHASIGPSTGVVTGISAGSTTITYALGTGCIAVAVVTINPLPANITGATSVCLSNTTSLSSSTTGGTWSSSNTTCASIGSLTGVVTGSRAGTAVITYKLPTGCKVYASMMVSPFAGAISGSANVIMGSVTTLSDGIYPGAWSSSNTGIATVDTGGVVAGVSLGNVTISYTVANGCGTARTTKVITVTPGITGPAAVCVGSTATLSSAQTGGLWSSSNGRATIGSTSGIVAGVIQGAVNITYTAGGSYTVQSMTVNDVQAIAGSSSIPQGTATTLTNAITGGAWSSSNTSLATVGTGGVVNGLLSGAAIISYTTPAGCTTNRTVTITTAPLSATTGATSVCVGLTATLTNATTGGTWSSSNARAIVGSTTGIVTGVTAGAVTITYRYGTSQTTSNITVNNSQPITGSSGLCEGQILNLANAIAGGTWSSNNISVATVGTSGSVSGISSGMAVISYVAPTTGCLSTKSVMVNAMPAAISGASTLAVSATITLSNGVAGGNWTSSNAHAGVGSTTGIVNGASTGSATISYTLTGGCMVTFNVAVTAHKDAPNPDNIIVAADEATIMILPNPNNGDFAVKGALSSTDDQDISMEVINSLGQVVHSGQYRAVGGYVNELMHLSDKLATGVYILNLHAKEEHKTFRIVVAK